MQQEQRTKYQAYAAAAQTVARTKQVVLLYEGVIRFLQQAKEALEAGKVEERYHLLIKASEIISGLQACLDFENGGDIANILYGFYASIDGRIFSVHRTGSIDTLTEVISELKQMRDVWQEIDDKDAGRSKAAAAPASMPPATGGTDSVTFTA